jgi:hypothetical protein
MKRCTFQEGCYDTTNAAGETMIAREQELCDQRVAPRLCSRDVVYASVQYLQREKGH